MIIVLSNRSVDESGVNPFSGEVGTQFFGDELSDNEGQSIRMAEAIYEIAEQDDDFDEDATLDFNFDEPQYDWSLQPVDAGQEATFLSTLANSVRSGEVSDRWVFFIHGNNQTIDKNLEKCRKLQMIHNVNVIAFSWPSWASIFSGALLQAASKEILLSGGLSKINPLFLFGKSAIKSKQAAYAKAVEHARKSPLALLKVLQLVDEHFASPLRDAGVSLNLLVHSLGNRVLQYTSELDAIPALFDNAILHQADVDSASHSTWVQNLNLSKRLYITHNKRDAVLHISDIFGSNPKRLGHTVKGPRASNVTAYIDYSAGRNVGLNHGLFLLEGFQNQALTTSFTRLLNGEASFCDGDLIDGFERLGDEIQSVSLRADKVMADLDEPLNNGFSPLAGFVDEYEMG